jgi:Uma2 family endonuclease
VDVFVDEYNAPQPDLLFVSTQHLSYLTADGVFGPPDLVVEIISPGSITRDRLDKLRLYARFGVPEYWIVDPKYRSVEVCQLTEVAGQPREYNVVSAVEESGAVQSKVLVGFTLDLADVFQA